MRQEAGSKRDREILRAHSLRPRIMLVGCEPFRRVRVVYRATERGPEFERYAALHPCPVCEGRVEDRPSLVPRTPSTIVICLGCHRMDAKHELSLSRDRNAARISERELDAATKRERLLRRTEAALAKAHPRLTESERRRIWCGYRSSLLAVHIPPEVSTRGANLAREGRTFLTRVGQEPNFDLILDAKGYVVGRWSDLERQAAEIASRGNALNVAPESIETE